MKRPVLDLETFLPYRLSVLTNTISGVLAEAYGKRYGLSISEWRVMAILGRFPESSAGEVAERAAMDKVAVSRAVSRLLDAGRIRRRFADADRRRSILELSDEGWRIYGKITPTILSYESALLSGLSRGERHQLDRLLARLAGKARALPPPEVA
jgi:DNA-binding MarR family transcriptional regulator